MLYRVTMRVCGVLVFERGVCDTETSQKEAM